MGRTLTIEEIMQLKENECLYIRIIDNFFSGFSGYYMFKHKNDFAINLYCKANDNFANLWYSDYGKTWLAYRNKEEAECKGELVGNKELTCQNITTNHPVDEFICSNCNFKMENFAEVEVDEDDGEIMYQAFEFKYCPNCGAKVAEGTNMCELIKKAVMKSLSAEKCASIVLGQSDFIVSKTKPNLTTPFKCYIYCTKGSKFYFIVNNIHLNGKVIGEFVCDYIEDCVPDYNPVTKEFFGYYFWLKNGMMGKVYMTDNELVAYGKGKMLYGLHISELKIYKEPKSLGKFKRQGILKTLCYVEEVHNE